MSLEKFRAPQNHDKKIKEGLDEHYGGPEYQQDPNRLNEKIDSLKLRARGVIKSFVKKQIEEDGLRFFSDHGHLNFTNEEFWGRYISPAPEGVNVTVYLQKNVQGDPMSPEGSRGEHMEVYIHLTDNERLKLAEKIKKDIELYKASDNPDSFILGQMQEGLETLTDGLPEYNN